MNFTEQDVTSLVCDWTRDRVDVFLLDFILFARLAFIISSWWPLFRIFPSRVYATARQPSKLDYFIGSLQRSNRTFLTQYIVYYYFSLKRDGISQFTNRGFMSLRVYQLALIFKIPSPFPLSASTHLFLISFLLYSS